jgi:hypothetical protein
MYNRRILINEDDRSRILNMHENHAKRNNLNFGRLRLNEATKKASEVLKTKDDIIAFQDWVVNTKKQNLGVKNPLGKGLGVDGIMNPGGNTEKAWNSGLGDEYMKVKGIPGSGIKIENITFKTPDGDLKYTDVNQLADAVKNKKVTMDTLVWWPGINPNQRVAIKSIPETEKAKITDTMTAINNAMGQIVPDAPVESKTYRISIDRTNNNVENLSKEQIIAKMNQDEAFKNAIKNDTAGYISTAADGTASWQSIKAIPELTNDINAAIGVADVGKDTGNPAVNAWLNTEFGLAYQKMKTDGTDPKAIEKFFDFLESAGKLPQGVDGKTFRNVLGQKADTFLGRVASGVKGAIKGATQGAKTGYQQQG